MKIGQFLLLKLAEECSEVAQRCSKQIQFGKDEVQKNQDWSNKDRLKQELLDLMSITRLLIENQELADITAFELHHAYESKTAKLAKYLKLSMELGQLEIEL